MPISAIPGANLRQDLGALCIPELRAREQRRRVALHKLLAPGSTLASGGLMFTGLIQATGTIESVTPAGGTLRIAIHSPELAPRLHIGDSIAVSGVCLTALAPEPSRFFAELAAETVQRTSLATLAPGTVVNLELPTPAGTPLGGHIVQGHVDATGSLLALEPIAGDGAAANRTDWRLRIAVPPAVGRFVVEKGSITIEGISLTVAHSLVSGERRERRHPDRRRRAACCGHPAHVRGHQPPYPRARRSGKPRGRRADEACRAKRTACRAREGDAVDGAGRGATPLADKPFVLTAAYWSRTATESPASSPRSMLSARAALCRRRLVQGGARPWPSTTAFSIPSGTRRWCASTNSHPPHVQLYVKVEAFNPLGSVKDRLGARRH